MTTCSHCEGTGILTLGDGSTEVCRSCGATGKAEATVETTRPGAGPAKASASDSTPEWEAKLDSRIDALHGSADPDIRALMRKLRNMPPKTFFELNPQSFSQTHGIALTARRHYADAMMAGAIVPQAATVDREVWQDISTAPKDGTRVDLWVVRERTGEGQRRTGCLWGRRAWGAEYVGEPGWRGIEDQYSVETPTHWRPLPAPPSAAPTPPTAPEHGGAPTDLGAILAGLSKVENELRFFIECVRALLRHTNPHLVNEGHAQQWFAVSDAIRNRVEPALDALAGHLVPRTASPDPRAAEPEDAFGAHILTGSLGWIGDREIGSGHVVLSEERYAYLRSLADPQAAEVEGLRAERASILATEWPLLELLRANARLKEIDALLATAPDPQVMTVGATNPAPGIAERLAELRERAPETLASDWGVEDCGTALWVGPMRPDGVKVDHIIYCKSDLDGYKAEYSARIRSEAHLICDLANLARSAALTATPTRPVESGAADDDAEESFQVGLRDGYERGIQVVAERLGLDAEYRWSNIPERCQDSPDAMLKNIVEHVEGLSEAANPTPSTSPEQALRGAAEALKPFAALKKEIERGAVESGVPVEGWWTFVCGWDDLLRAEAALAALSADTATDGGW